MFWLSFFGGVHKPYKIGENHFSFLFLSFLKRKENYYFQKLRGCLQTQVSGPESLPFFFQSCPLTTFGFWKWFSLFSSDWEHPFFSQPFQISDSRSCYLCLQTHPSSLYSFIVFFLIIRLWFTRVCPLCRHDVCEGSQEWSVTSTKCTYIYM